MIYKIEFNFDYQPYFLGIYFVQILLLQSILFSFAEVYLKKNPDMVKVIF